jgi:hypothetical protein
LVAMVGTLLVELDLSLMMSMFGRFGGRSIDSGSV